MLKQTQLHKHTQTKPIGTEIEEKKHKYADKT